MTDFRKTNINYKSLPIFERKNTLNRDRFSKQRPMCLLGTCRILNLVVAVRRIAPLTMARRTLDVNANGTRMRNRVTVYVRVYSICTYAYAYRAPHCGCDWCGRRDADYAVHMLLRLVLSRMSLLWSAVHVHGPYSYRLML